jgi:hypothetical protein
MLLHLPLDDLVVELVCLAGAPFFGYQQPSEYQIYDEMLRKTGRHNSVMRQDIDGIRLEHDICVFR